MFFFRVILMGLRGLQANLLRSLLATLGVIIGVGAVIAAMSILEGLQRDILERFKSLGSDQIYVFPGEAKSRGRAVGTVQTLRLDDVDVLLSESESIAAAAPESMRFAQVKFFAKNKNVQILGTNQDYGPMNNYWTKHGEFISADDVRAERRVVVLGHRVARDLFGDSAAIGQAVRIGVPGGRRSSFRIIGIMEKKGNLGFRTVDNQVIVPISTAMKRLFGVDSVDMITVQSADPDQVDFCQREIKKVLRKQHKIPAGYKDDFRVYSREEQLKQFRQASTLFAVVFYSIAGISLVVGGIGIMNIMLVSVTERTREIGVRIAVGAQRSDILWQFLVEAGSISIVGGAFGVALGFAMAGILENISSDLLETYTPPKVIVWALLMAVTTGIVSGLYPAYIASRLDPVEALRYE